MSVKSTSSLQMSLCGMLWGLLAWSGLVLPAFAQEPATKVADEPREAIVRAAREYELFLGPDRLPLTMQKEPILRWPNPTREVPTGATFLWTLNGRPEAIGCVWKHAVLCHAFQSLSTSKLVAEHGGHIVWHPESPGISLQGFPKAPEPAESPVTRLSQMRDLARRFQCRLREDDQKTEKLRLLPSPLYRYETRRKDLFDGALFAYVQGTDPEVILVLEAHRRDGKREWRYALTRRSALGLDADLDGDHIWSVPQSAGSPDEPWFQGGVASPNEGGATTGQIDDNTKKRSTGLSDARVSSSSGETTHRVVPR